MRCMLNFKDAFDQVTFMKNEPSRARTWGKQKGSPFRTDYNKLTTLIVRKGDFYGSVFKVARCMKWPDRVFDNYGLQTFFEPHLENMYMCQIVYVYVSFRKHILFEFMF